MRQPSTPEAASWLVDVDDADVGSHAVTFYDDEDALVGLVAAFLAPAHDSGGAVVALVAPDHRSRLAQALAGAGIPVDAARCSLLTTDAVRAKVMTDGKVDREAFRSLVEATLDAVARPGQPLRIYGALVADLFRDGQVVAAMDVEDVWNLVVAERRAALLCAYPAEVHRDPSMAGEICGRHDSVVGIDGGMPQRFPSPGSVPLDDKTLLAALAHDLQGPAAIVSGLLDLLLEDRDSLAPDTVTDLLTRASSGARRIQRLVTDVAALSHMDAGSFDYHPRPFDLEALARREVEDVALTMQRHVGVAVEPGLPRVYADPDRQAQILNNLLGNALKFSGDGTPVELGLQRQGDWVVVRVRDHGPGLDPTDQRRIFEAFARANSNGIHPGSGLGLYIARVLVEGQGGRIWVASEPDRGATFGYTVPVASDA